MSNNKSEKPEIKIGQEVLLKKQGVRGKVFSISASPTRQTLYNVEASDGRKYQVGLKEIKVLND